jgi:hypothetical protein
LSAGGGGGGGRGDYIRSLYSIRNA